MLLFFNLFLTFNTSVPEQLSFYHGAIAIASVRLC